MALVAYVVQSSRFCAASSGTTSWDRLTQRIADLDHAMWERATALATRAGLDVARNVWHNAMLSRASGNPWSGVDYALLREAMWVDAARERVWHLRSRLWARYERTNYPERYREIERIRSQRA